MMIARSLLLFLVMCLLASSCGDDEVTIPKPRMYPKVDYPVQTYQPFKKDYCSMSFEYPTSATIEKKEYFFDDKPNNECWFDITSKVLNYDIHCSYYDISAENTLSKLIDDSHKMANKHNQKANYREEFYINNKQGVSGIQFEIEGPVASPLQFYVTDSTTHFFRASLYFNSKVNPDSIAPILKFVKTDIKHMVSTFEW